MNLFFLDPRAARATWTILAILGVLGLAYVVRGVLLLIALSVFFAYLLFPVVRLTQRWLIDSRLVAIGVVYLVVLVAVSGIGVGVGPRLSTEVQSLAQQLPEMSKRIQSGEMVVSFMAREGWERQQIRAIDRLVQTHMGAIIGYVQQAAASLLKWLAGAWVIVLIPVLAFFILKDAERLIAAVILRLSPPGQHGMWSGISEDLHLLLGQYVRALLVLALMTFVVWAAVFLTAGVPYALVLAGIGGVLEFIPVIGPLTSGIVAIGVSLFSGYEHPWLLAIFILVWRGVQDWSSPLIMGRGVKIHPGVVTVGVLAGGQIAGVAGMFLSIPVIAAVRIVWRHLQAPENAPGQASAEPGSVAARVGGQAGRDPSGSRGGPRLDQNPTGRPDDVRD